MARKNIRIEINGKPQIKWLPMSNLVGWLKQDKHNSTYMFCCWYLLRFCAAQKTVKWEFLMKQAMMMAVKDPTVPERSTKQILTPGFSSQTKSHRRLSMRQNARQQSHSLRVRLLAVHILQLRKCKKNLT